MKVSKLILNEVKSNHVAFMRKELKFQSDEATDHIHTSYFNRVVEPILNMFNP